MPAYCSLCASDDYTSERETEDGRVFAVCSARYHGAEPFTALGALTEARRQGVAVPDDLSIVGFDDIPETRCTQPGLTC